MMKKYQTHVHKAILYTNKFERIKSTTKKFACDANGENPKIFGEKNEKCRMHSNKQFEKK